MMIQHNSDYVVFCIYDIKALGNIIGGNRSKI